MCNHCIAYVHEQELYLGYCTHQQNNCHCKDDCALAPYTIQTALNGCRYVVTLYHVVKFVCYRITNMTLVTLFKCMAVGWSYSEHLVLASLSTMHISSLHMQLNKYLTTSKTGS